MTIILELPTFSVYPNTILFYFQLLLFSSLGMNLVVPKDKISEPVAMHACY
jgi:hypothetical protein